MMPDAAAAGVCDWHRSADFGRVHAAVYLALVPHGAGTGAAASS